MGQRRTGEQGLIALLEDLPARHGGLVQAMALQLTDEHLQIAQRTAQPPDLGGGRLQGVDTRQAAQRTQQATQAPHDDAQVVQGFAVGSRRQPRPGRQQGHLQGDEARDQPIGQCRH
ncbi:hypothetical protein D3C78_1638830 [compost metagenome]